MKRRNYFYIVTNKDNPQYWIDKLEAGEFEGYIGSMWWPYNLAAVKVEKKRSGCRNVYKIGLPFYNFIKQVK